MPQNCPGAALRHRVLPLAQASLAERCFGRSALTVGGAEVVESMPTIRDRCYLTHERQLCCLCYWQGDVESEAHGTLAHLDHCRRLCGYRLGHRHGRGYCLARLG